MPSMSLPGAHIAWIFNCYGRLVLMPMPDLSAARSTVERFMRSSGAFNDITTLLMRPAGLRAYFFKIVESQPCLGTPSFFRRSFASTILLRLVFNSSFFSVTSNDFKTPDQSTLRHSDQLLKFR